MKRNSVSKSGQRRIEAIIRKGERFTRRRFLAVDRARLRDFLKGDDCG
jgi:hypothetical protein